MDNELNEILQSCQDHVREWRDQARTLSDQPAQQAMAQRNLERAEKRLALAENYQFTGDYGILAQLYDEMQLNPFERLDS